MTEKKKYIEQKEKKEVRLKLYKRDESKCHYCHYCGIEEEDFFRIWGKFYGGKRRKLEVDRKDNKKRDYIEENCVLACPVCNNAKSDKFTYEEFKKVGKAIKEIWLSRKEVIKKAKGRRQSYQKKI